MRHHITKILQYQLIDRIGIKGKSFRKIDQPLLKQWKLYNKRICSRKHIYTTINLYTTKLNWILLKKNHISVSSSRFPKVINEHINDFFNN